MLACIRANAEEVVVSLVSPEIPHLLSSKQSEQGPYNRIFTDVNNSNIVSFNHSYMPPARAYLAFENNLFDCVFPVNNSTLALNKPLLLSEPLGIASAYIYTLKSRPVIKSVQSLNNMTLGVRRGFDYGGFKFPHSTKTVTVGTIEQNLQLLKLNRIDAFVAYEPDSLAVLDNYPKIEVHRDDDFSIYVQKDRIACYETPRNRKYINKINKQLRILNIH